MLNLTELKRKEDIHTYSYSVSKGTDKTSDVKAAGIKGKIKNQDTEQTNQSFKSCMNNAASTADKTSKSDYTQVQWDAQRKKNNAIAKLQIIDGDVAALERVAPNASEDVKSAWMDAARETGFNGLGYGTDGDSSQATSLYAEMKTSAKMTDNNISGVQDILGGTVDSAIDAISSAKYDRINSKASGTINVNAEKEIKFYDSLLQKLNGLKDGSYLPDFSSVFDRMNKIHDEIFPFADNGNAVEKEVPQNYYASAFFHETTTTAPDGESYELKARYPENYDPVNPVIEVYVKGKDERLFVVKVNDVNPQNASQTELYGLFSYAEDDRNVPRNIDPESADIYYSSLDRKYDKMKEEAGTEPEEIKMVNSFKSMDNLSYWDRKELLESINF
ncbi:hypothetical protein [Butyrivibrio sp. AE3004]|uniref:hypothetical protein n=1 Tax=Butyrivibrio sp. AE3004 TaxID=1506994 RepID=UPI000494277C|nr:hypothetical protein [Butyrivibrio sp. AE3004]